MQPIDGVSIDKAIKDADIAFAKIAQARVTDYVRGLKVQSHNLKMKSMRLQKEADMASVSAAEVDARIAKLSIGDWSAVDPFEMSDATGKKDDSRPEQK